MAETDKSCQLELPLRQCTIIITELLTGDERTPRQFHGFPRTFKTVAHLRGFLWGSYPVAHSLGYKINRRPPKVNWKNIGRLSIEIKDRFHAYHFEFDDVHQFVRFLQNNPAVAELVEYPPKPERY